MMFAVAFEADATQHDHLVIAFNLVKGLLKYRGGILSIAYERLFECARYPSRVSTRPSRSGLSPLQRMMVRTAASTSARSGLLPWCRVRAGSIARTLELMTCFPSRQRGQATGM